MMIMSCLLVAVGRCRIDTCTKGDPVPYLRKLHRTRIEYERE